MMTEKRDVSIRVKCQHSGFGFGLDAELAVDQIGELMKKLQAAGITPAQSPYVGAGGFSTNGNAQTDAPVCPVHGKPMKPSKFENGGYYCSFKMPDGSYCDEKAA